MPIEETSDAPTEAVILPIAAGSPAAEAWARNARFKASTAESHRAARAARRAAHPDRPEGAAS
jgi:hypothetical protein